MNRILTKLAPYQLWLILIGGLFYTLFSSYLTYYILYRGNAPELFDVYFGFGDLAQSLVNGDGYVSTNRFWTAHRMPLIPYFLWMASTISTKTIVVLIIKNLLLYPLTILALIYLAKSLKTVSSWFVWLIPLYLALFPHFIMYTSMLDAEEGFLIHFLVILFVCGLFFDRLSLNDKPLVLFALALLTALLFLTKSSMFLVSIVFCVAFYLKSGRKWMVLSTFGLVLLGGVLLWGVSNQLNSGRFTISSSWNGKNLYKGNNVEFDTYYPRRNLDLLEVSGSIPPAETIYEDEWAADAAYSDQAIAFIVENPSAVARSILVKSYIFFVEIRKVPYEPSSGAIGWVTAAGFLFFRLLFWGSVVWGSYVICRNRFSRLKRLDVFTINLLIFLALIGAYAAPYMAGFAYSRHIAPIIMPTLVFVFYLVDEYITDLG